MGDPPSAAPRKQLASGSDVDGGRAGQAGLEDVEWFDATWNPTAGCSQYSPGCEHCYAMRIAARLARMGGKTGARYTGLTAAERSGPIWTGEIRVAEDLLDWPLLRRRPRRIAVDLMSDLFHENLATATIDLLHAVMRAAHWHRFLVLTKRSGRMQAYYSDPETPRRIAEKSDLLPSLILPLRARRGRSPRQADPVMRPAGSEPWPLPNLWLGVSVEDQDRIARISDLLQTPAALRWVCFEPLLDQVRPEAVLVGTRYFDALTGGHYTIDSRGHTAAAEGPARQALDWIVTGGEIGPGARPMQPQWVRYLRDKCVSSGAAFFFKQWGEWAPASDDPLDATMVRVGKRSAGRLLDGRTWDEIPVTPRAR
jgi:protein gp37